MLNHGVTQTYLMTNTSRKIILIGRLTIKTSIKSVVTICNSDIRWKIFRANGVSVITRYIPYDAKMKNKPTGKIPKMMRARIGAYSGVTPGKMLHDRAVDPEHLIEVPVHRKLDFAARPTFAPARTTSILGRE